MHYPNYNSVLVYRPFLEKSKKHDITKVIEQVKFHNNSQINYLYLSLKKVYMHNTILLTKLIIEKSIYLIVFRFRKGNILKRAEKL